MQKASLPWYLRNYPAWIALVILLIGILLHFTHYRLFFFLASWLYSYAGILTIIFSLSGVLAALGAWIARRRRAHKTLGIALFGFVVSCLMLYEANTVEKRSYDKEAVSFRNENITLYGTIYRPSGRVKAGIVLVHGSAHFDRGFYHVWADYFARNGLVVLSFDKRGTGLSEGIFVEDNNTSIENLSLLASDLVSGLHRLAKESALNNLPIGIWGISQAGWIIPIVAEKYPLDFALFASGPTCTTQEEHVYSRIRGDHVDAATGSREEAERAVLENGPGGFDPIPFLSGMTTPALWVFGEADDSIPVGRSAAVLDSLIDRGQPFEYIILPFTDHLLVTRAGFPDFNPEYWRVTEAWLRRQGIIE